MISYMVAMSKNHVIGKDNDLPWQLPADLAYFKKVTTGHTIVMGRKTYESIGRPLPERTNVILTRNKNYTAEQCHVLHSVEEVLTFIKKQAGECFIIGGADLFSLFLPYVSRMYITMIDKQFAGDTYFPKIDMTDWKLISEEKGKKDERNPYDYKFLIYEKNPR